MVGEQLAKTNVPEPLHTHLLGLKTFLRNLLPVDGKLAHAKRPTTYFQAFHIYNQRTGLCAGRALLIVQPGTKAEDYNILPHLQQYPC
jgi:hypothetical protein